MREREKLKTFNVQHSTPNAQGHGFGLGLKIGGWALNVEC
jgi:hypothetical protein